MELLLQTEFNERQPYLSPDGRLLAYVSDEFGPRRVIVRPFPNVSDSTWQVPVDSCEAPRWSPQGDSLFVWCEDGLFALPVNVNSPSPIGRPERLFAVEPYFSGAYDVSTDGRRFLMIKDITEPDSELVVVLNWLDELKRLVPTD